MADLSTMFNQLGPAGGSILAGVQLGNEANAAKQEQAMRQAQMDKIIEETNQAKLMNPLALEAKQQEIKSGNLKAQAEEHAYHTKVLGDVIPELERVKGGPGAQLAFLQDYTAKRGVPLGPEELAHFSQDPDLLKTLKSMHTWGITQDKDYQKALAVANVNAASHKYSADTQAAATRYGADIRAQTAKDRAAAAQSDAAMLAKLGNNYAGQAAYYEKKAKEAYEAGNNESYIYYKDLKANAEQKELAKAAASQDARARADTQRLEALGGNSVVVKPPKPLTTQQMRDAL